MEKAPSSSFLGRHEFLLRRLHSLTGLVPVGAYMVVHLLTNSSILNSVSTFQNAVYQIHSLGKALWVVEWAFIFLPLLFHAFLGLVIIRGGLPNTSSYPYSGNIRYTFQRATGLVAFAFIFWHVFHLHGWVHFEWWLEHVARPFGGGQFRAYNAASTASQAIGQSLFISMLYLIGVAACVFHLANGVWTMGITWGAWTTPESQRRADYLCLALGLGLGVVGLGAWAGFSFSVDAEKAEQKENEMYESRVASGMVVPDEHKRSGDHSAKPESGSGEGEQKGEGEKGESGEKKSATGGGTPGRDEGGAAQNGSSDPRETTGSARQLVESTNRGN